MLPITGNFSSLKFGDEFDQNLPHLGRIINNNALFMTGRHYPEKF